MKTLLVADVHANLAALEAVLDAEGSWDRFVFLGDAVLAGPQPDEVLSLLHDVADVCLMGNHEREVLYLDVVCPGPPPGGLWKRWHREAVSSVNLAFMATFQEEAVIGEEGKYIHLEHGILPRELGRRLWPDSGPEAFGYLSKRAETTWIAVAHSHFQFDTTREGIRFTNPGSAGTAYLGRPVSCYAVLTDGNLALRAVPYDIESTCQAMQDRGDGVIDQAYIDEWKETWRTASLPARYGIRDYAPLREQGYR